MELPGLSSIFFDVPSGDSSELVMIQRPLQRVMAFTGHTIDDVINSPIARREVLGYYKLYRWVQRNCEIGELERQWNANA